MTDRAREPTRRLPDRATIPVADGEGIPVTIPMVIIYRHQVYRLDVTPRGHLTLSRLDRVKKNACVDTTNGVPIAPDTQGGRA